jgi:hypothetical protein
VSYARLSRAEKASYDALGSRTRPGRVYRSRIPARRPQFDPSMVRCTECGKSIPVEHSASHGEKCKRK